MKEKMNEMKQRIDLQRASQKYDQHISWTFIEIEEFGSTKLIVTFETDCYSFFLPGF